MTNFVRELDWDNVQKGDLVRITLNDTAYEGRVFSGLESKWRIILPSGTSLPLELAEQEGYSLYISRSPALFNPVPVDSDMEIRNAKLAPYTRRKLPVEKTPWSPFQIGVAATIVITAVILLGFLVLRR
jgi:hypothetical protein